MRSNEITYDVDGLRMVGHLARPDGEGPWPAVLIGHDGVGLDEYQRQRADDLAEHGYLAFAMDYHGGEVYFNRPAAMLERVMPLLADVERMRAIGRAALEQLLTLPVVDHNRIAALGYGAGGHIVLELARVGVRFKAIAVVHPSLPVARAEDWKHVTSTFLLCTGSEDPLCTPEQVLTFGRALQEAGVDWRVNIYGGAKHAFWARPRNPDGSLAEGANHTMATVPGVGYHAKHTTRAWGAVLDLLGETF
jgi:dienelactone hydrolase